MNILFVPPGTEQTASARFRANWVAEYMPKASVIPYNQVTQADIDQADVLIWGKRIEPFNQHPGQRIFWDICDPVHWYNDPTIVREFSDICERVVTSNDGLTLDFNAWHGSEKAVTIADRMKLEHYPKRRVHAYSNPVKLIWFGNYPNRWALMGAMGEVIRSHYCGIKVELTICDENEDDKWQAAELQINHVRWSLDNENNILSSHDLAILPDMAGRNGAVKSNNKRLTAWANGLPVYDGKEPFDWLVKLCTGAELRQSIAAANYQQLERYWQVEQSAKEWMELIG